MMYAMIDYLPLLCLEKESGKLFFGFLFVPQAVSFCNGKIQCILEEALKKEQNWLLSFTTIIVWNQIKSIIFGKQGSRYSRDPRRPGYSKNC